MSLRPAPEIPDYRITLFYGPEASDAREGERHCVFNVKKRSWKGGIQVEVRIADSQVAALRRGLEFDAWLETALRGVAVTDLQEYRHRADDVFVQHLCLLKLEVAIAAGLTQQNAAIEASECLDRLDSEARLHRDRMRQAILAELDVPLR